MWEGSTVKRILHLEEVCMGCKLCEVHCLVEHSASKDIIKAYKKESPEPMSRVRVQVNKPFVFTARCQQCKNPLCVASCLTGAMHIEEETGLVLHDDAKCVGCWTCIAVCPFGAIKMVSSPKRHVVKCDLCPELEIPACVANCPNDALIVQEVEI
jgi:carbon-monoxide dehydrogenase iron sulfur subunit